MFFKKSFRISIFDIFKGFKGGKITLQGSVNVILFFQGFKGFFKGSKKFKGVSRVSRNSRVAGHPVTHIYINCKEKNKIVGNFFSVNAIKMKLCHFDFNFIKHISAKFQLNIIYHYEIIGYFPEPPNNFP